jgi:hypothetical protein
LGSTIITSADISGLAENSYYYFRVRAYDGEFYGPWAYLGPVRVGEVNNPPGDFNLLEPVDGATTARNPFFDWTDAIDPDPTDTVTYTLYVYSDAALTTVAFSKPGLTVSEYQMLETEPLDSFTDYWWRVEADDTHWQKWSVETWMFTTNDQIDPTGPGETVIDDYEGVAVNDPDPAGMGEADEYYYVFTAPGDTDPTFERQQIEVYADTYSMKFTYPAASVPENAWRGFGGILSPGATPTPKDISAYDTLSFYIKGDGSEGTVKVQLKDSEGDNYGTTNPIYEFTLFDTDWHKCEIPLSAFSAEIADSDVDDDGLTLTAIAEYQFVFVGSAASQGNGIFIDDVKAEESGQQNDIETTITMSDTDITVSWQMTTPGNADIYTISGNADVDVFSNDPNDWTLEYPGQASTQIVEAGQIGTGTQKYYKVVAASAGLTANDLLVDVVGKFDIAVGPSDTQPERAFFSIPLVQSSSTLPDIFGNQAEENDLVAIFDMNRMMTDAAIFDGAVWLEADPVNHTVPLVTDLNIGYAYVYGTFTSRYLTVVGSVMETDNQRDIQGGSSGGLPQYAEWVANAFPISANIANAGFNSYSVGGDPSVGASAYHFDANANMIDEDSDLDFDESFALHTGPSDWTDPAAQPATLMLRPGKGYMFAEPTIPHQTWTQQRP